MPSLNWLLIKMSIQVLNHEYFCDVGWKNTSHIRFSAMFFGSLKQSCCEDNHAPYRKTIVGSITTNYDFFLICDFENVNCSVHLVFCTYTTRRNKQRGLWNVRMLNRCTGSLRYDINSCNTCSIKFPGTSIFKTKLFSCAIIMYCIRSIHFSVKFEIFLHVFHPQTTDRQNAYSTWILRPSSLQ